MGMMKHKMEEINALYDIASDALERVGAIKTCEVHGDRYLADESKLVDAYKLGNFWISKGTLSCDRRELTDAIKKILEITPEECLGCEYIRCDDD